MTPQEFSLVTELARRVAGLVFTPDKAYLVEARLAPLLRERQMSKVSELVNALRRGEAELVADVVDALTTNETSFFRDKVPFARFRDEILPSLAARRKGALVKVWCAACSTGQEPYSLAILMERAAKAFPGVTLDILGSDISHTCLESAYEGLYSQFEVQRGLSTADLVLHFEAEGKSWRLQRRLRDAVRWRQFNLLHSPSSLGRFDVVFCRNVLIYFDTETRGRVLEQIATVMAPDGYLILGAAETVLGLTDAFEASPGAPGVYRPVSLNQRGKRAVVR